MGLGQGEPDRIADYFLVIGLDPDIVVLQDDLGDHGQQRSPMQQGKEGEASWDPIEDIVLKNRYKPKVLDRFPLLDYTDTTLPPQVAMFAHPEGLSCKRQAPLPIFFTIVFTSNEGRRVYASVLTFHDVLQQESLTNMVGQDVKLPEGEKLWIPKCLCVVSHWPFHDVYKEFLKQLYRLSVSTSRIALERLICNFMQEVPLPPKGLIRVQYTIADKIVILQRSPTNKLPACRVPMEVLFSLLDRENVSMLFTCILLEQKIIVYSEKISVLTVITESLLTLIFPFKWDHVYVPVLPVQLLEFISAPTPFLIGVHPGSLAHRRDEFMEHVNEIEDAVVVDLDNNKIRMPTHEVPQLPDRQRKKLLEHLEMYGDVFDPTRKSLVMVDLAFPMAPTPAESERKVESKWNGQQLQYSFLRVFLSMFQRYRECLIVPSSDDPNPDDLFKKDRLLEHSPKESRRFLSQFLDTSMFSIFIYHRIFDSGKDLEHVFFDEAIEAKSNRSALRFSKKPTPFLDDKFQAVTRTHVAIAPYDTDLEGALFKYETFPRLRHDLFPEPREIRSLVTGELYNRKTSASLGVSGQIRLEALEKLQRSASSSNLAASVGSNKPLIVSSSQFRECIFGTWFFLHMIANGDAAEVAENGGVDKGKSEASVAEEGFKKMSQAHEQMELVFEVLGRMKLEDLHPDGASYMAVLEACGRAGQPERALAVLDEMHSRGMRPDGSVFGTIMKAVASSPGEQLPAFQTASPIGKPRSMQMEKHEEENFDDNLSPLEDNMSPGSRSDEGDANLEPFVTLALSLSPRDAAGKLQVGAGGGDGPMTLASLMHGDQDSKAVMDGGLTVEVDEGGGRVAGVGAAEVVKEGEGGEVEGGGEYATGTAMDATVESTPASPFELSGANSSSSTSIDTSGTWQGTSGAAASDGLSADAIPEGSVPDHSAQPKGSVGEWLLSPTEPEKQSVEAQNMVPPTVIAAPADGDGAKVGLEAAVNAQPFTPGDAAGGASVGLGAVAGACGERGSEGGKDGQDDWLVQDLIGEVGGSELECTEDRTEMTGGGTQEGSRLNSDMGSDDEVASNALGSEASMGISSGFPDHESTPEGHAVMHASHRDANGSKGGEGWGAGEDVPSRPSVGHSFDGADDEASLLVVDEDDEDGKVHDAFHIPGMAEEETTRESSQSYNMPRCSSFPDRGAMKSNHRRSFSADDWREVDKEVVVESMVADATADGDQVVRLSRASSDQNISPSSNKALWGTAGQGMWGVREGVGSPGAASPVRRSSDTTGVHSPSGKLLESPAGTPQRPTRRQGVDGSPVRYPSSGDVASIYVDHKPGQLSSNGAAGAAEAARKALLSEAARGGSRSSSAVGDGAHKMFAATSGGVGSSTQERPRVELCIHDTCPDCGRELDEEKIKAGWMPDEQLYTTQCPHCPRKFVARFAVVHSSASSRSPPLSCECLSPLVIRKEVQNLMRGVEGREGEERLGVGEVGKGSGKWVTNEWDQSVPLFVHHLRTKQPAIFWNIVWHFMHCKLPLSILHVEEDVTVKCMPKSPKQPAVVKPPPSPKSEALMSPSRTIMSSVERKMSGLFSQKARS